MAQHHTTRRYTGRLLTVKEVAAILRISEASVRNWVNDGRLSGATIGKKMYRIQGASVDAILYQGHGPDTAGCTKDAPKAYQNPHKKHQPLG